MSSTVVAEVSEALWMMSDSNERVEAGPRVLSYASCATIRTPSPWLE
jgi:hypothetical protein